MATDTKGMNTDSKTFCIMPWVQINLSLPNTYNPCCNSGIPYDNTTAYDTSIKDAFAGTKASQLRNQLNDGEKPAICDVCWVKEDAGVFSERQGYNKQFKNYFHIDKPTLKYLDIEFDKRDNVIDLMDQISIRQTLSTIPLATFVIGCDNFLNHASRVLKKRGLFLGGANDPKQYGWEQNINLYNKKHCSPCLTSHKDHICCFAEGINNIPFNEIKKAINELK